MQAAVETSQIDWTAADCFDAQSSSRSTEISCGAASCYWVYKIMEQHEQAVWDLMASEQTKSLARNPFDLKEALHGIFFVILHEYSMWASPFDMRALLSSSTPLLGKPELDDGMKALPAWALNSEGTMISRKFVAKNFVAAIKFFEDVSKLAEEANHHPDLHLTGYRNVEVITHHTLVRTYLVRCSILCISSPQHISGL